MAVAARSPNPDPPEIVYPDTDGAPMGESGEQAAYIVLLASNIQAIFPNDLVQLDQFWYPVEGRPDIVTAPDVYVAFGRSPEPRPSYLQWKEGGRPPDVVIEIWSPSNTFADRLRKLEFYRRHGVREFIAFDPKDGDLTAFEREGDELVLRPTAEGWRSPLLGARFTVQDGKLLAFHPDGRPFRTLAEERARAEEERARAEEERARVEAELAAQQARIAELEALLRARG